METPENSGWFIVTGANRGLGEALTAKLLDSGVRVLAVSRSPGPIEPRRSLPGKAGSTLAYYQLDIEEPASIKAFGNWLQARGMVVRCLVNNAGVCLDGSGSFKVEEARFDLLTPETLEQTFRVNLFGPIQLVQAVYLSMVPGGLILNVTSSLADPELLDAGWLAYRASKAALNVMTKVLAKELEGENIKVNAVAPGWVKTAMGGAEAPVEAGDAADWIHGIIQRSLAAPGPTGAIYTYDA